MPIKYTFSGYNNTNHVDWKDVDNVGIDAPAFLLTGVLSGGDYQRDKQIVYMTAHFAATETVGLPLVLSGTDYIDGVLGGPYSDGPWFATGGTPPYTYLITGDIPPGLTQLNSTSSVLSGTPTEIGEFQPINVSVTDADSNNVSVNSKLSITPSFPSLYLGFTSFDPSTGAFPLQIGLYSYNNASVGTGDVQVSLVQNLFRYDQRDVLTPFSPGRGDDIICTSYPDLTLITFAAYNASKTPVDDEGIPSGKDLYVFKLMEDGTYQDIYPDISSSVTEVDGYRNIAWGCLNAGPNGETLNRATCNEAGDVKIYSYTLTDGVYVETEVTGFVDAAPMRPNAVLGYCKPNCDGTKLVFPPIFVSSHQFQSLYGIVTDPVEAVLLIDPLEPLNDQVNKIVVERVFWHPTKPGLMYVMGNHFEPPISGFYHNTLVMDLYDLSETNIDPPRLQRLELPHFWPLLTPDDADYGGVIMFPTGNAFFIITSSFGLDGYGIMLDNDGLMTVGTDGDILIASVPSIFQANFNTGINTNYITNSFEGFGSPPSECNPAAEVNEDNAFTDRNFQGTDINVIPGVSGWLRSV